MSILRKTLPSADSTKLSIAFVIGLSVKSLFLFLGMFVSGQWSSMFFPTFHYFLFISALGALLAGLFAGFISMDKTAGAYIGLLCALLPTLVYSIVTPAWTPIGGLIFIFGLVPLDVLAVVGGTIGASIKTKMMVAACLIALVSVSLVFAHGLVNTPTVHYGDLIIDGNESLIIENRNYEQYGNIIVRENATITLRNSMVVLRQQRITLSINVSQEASLILENAQLTTTHPRLPFSDTPFIYLSDKAVLRVDKAERISGFRHVVATNQSEIAISDSIVLLLQIVCHDTSTVTAHNSHIEDITSYDSASVSFQNSSAKNYWCRDNSSLQIEDSILPRAPRKSVFLFDYSSVLIRKSTVDHIGFSSYQGYIVFENSTISEISIIRISDFHMAGNVTVKASIETFNGTMTRNYKVSTPPHTQLNITDYDSTSLLLEVQSDIHGQANFDITFTTGNFTSQCKINNERIFNVTSTTPIIYP